MVTGMEAGWCGGCHRADHWHGVIQGRHSLHCTAAGKTKSCFVLETQIIYLITIRFGKPEKMG